MADGSNYVLGYSDGEFDRLVRQATRFRELTAGCLRAAGLSEGQRVLDLGSGLGDVSMLASSIVGKSGAVVGVERDAASVAVAQARVAQACLANVNFFAGDVADVAGSGPFDALIGRFILQFVPDPVAVMRAAAQTLVPRGIVAFQEVFWRPALAANAHLPLWSACASAAHDALARFPADTQIGSRLHGIFVDAGLPPPQLKLELLVGSSPDEVLWPFYLLRSVYARTQLDDALDALGDFSTLAVRLLEEAETARSPVTSIGVVSAWARTHPA